jgi:hypothetical protein
LDVQNLFSNVCKQLLDVPEQFPDVPEQLLDVQKLLTNIRREILLLHPAQLLQVMPLLIPSSKFLVWHKAGNILAVCQGDQRASVGNNRAAHSDRRAEFVRNLLVVPLSGECAESVA